MRARIIIIARPLLTHFLPSPQVHDPSLGRDAPLQRHRPLRRARRREPRGAHRQARRPARHADHPRHRRHAQGPQHLPGAGQVSLAEGLQSSSERDGDRFKLFFQIRSEQVLRGQQEEAEEQRVLLGVRYRDSEVPGVKVRVLRGLRRPRVDREGV